MTNAKHAYVVISYCPLLIGPAGTLYDLKSADAQALSEYMEQLPSGEAIACLWVKNGKHVDPVFLYKNADAIYEHLLVWSENEPEKWFEFMLCEKNGRYAVVCFPQLYRSIERFKIAFQLSTGFPADPKAEYNLIFKPLMFISRDRGVFDRVEVELKRRKKLRIGFMTWNKDIPPTATDVCANDIQWVKSIPRVKNLSKYDKYLEGVFGDK